MISAVVLGYAVLAGLAAALRWPYRIWLALLLAALGAVGFEWRQVRDASVLAQAPAYAQELLTSLRERPWPERPAELAQLIASFRALHDQNDANQLLPLYRLQVAHGLAGEPPERFGSVAEALAWKPPEPKPGANTSPWLEGMHAERRAIKEMLEIQAPRQAGWPPELARDMPLEEGAREIAPGVWLEAKAENPHVGTLRFPVSVHHRGEASIDVVHVTVLVQAPGEADQPGGRHPIFTCRATLHDFAPGETRLFSCPMTISLGTDKRPLQRALDHVEAFRSGALDVRMHAGGSLDSSLLKVPDADTLIAAQLQRWAQLKESDKQAQAHANAVAPSLERWLEFGAIFAAGMLFPGLRRGCLSAPITLALSAAGFIAAMIAGWWIGAHTPGVSGWEAIIAIFSAFEYGVPFIAGLLFGNLVYLRQRVA
jgi:hypothetical protein